MLLLTHPFVSRRHLELLDVCARQLWAADGEWDQSLFVFSFMAASGRLNR
jgi:hypothetical protein